MALLTTGCVLESGVDSDRGATSGSDYAMYGLHFRSEISLTVAPNTNLSHASPDCFFRWARPGEMMPNPDGPVIAGLRCDAPCHNGEWVTKVSRGPSGSWFYYDAVGYCFVAANARNVVVYPRRDYDPKALGMLLTGQVATFILHKLGYPSLHASAIVTDQGTVVFLGDPGHGKSTMAGYFLKQGHALLTDDVLPLRDVAGEIHGGPSIPMMKLWPQTAERIVERADELPGLTESVRKKLLLLDAKCNMHLESAPIRAIYVLQRYEPTSGNTTDVNIERLDTRQSFVTLLSHTSNRAYLLPNENAMLPSIVSKMVRQSRARILSYPNGFEYQALVYNQILQDMIS